MSKIGQDVIKLEEDGLLTYDEGFNQYVRAIENDPEYVRRVLEETERRENDR